MKALLAVLLTALVATASAAPLIQHRFLASDESRGQLLWVDQFDPAKSWNLKTPVKCRDLQLIGQQQILLSGNDGYYVYDLTTRSLVKELHQPAYKGTASVRRLANGRTLIGCNQNGITVYELGPDDALLSTAKFPQLNTLRLMRLTPTGTLLFGANGNLVIEADLTGKVLQQFVLPAPAKHVYQALRLPSGNILASVGYGHFLCELDPAGKLVKRIDPPASTPENLYHFFSGFQLLKNGHIVQCNWTGHGPQDSTKGVQLVEFDATGKIVWSWHDAQLAGTIHGIILLDDLDPAVLNDDISGTLQAVPSR